MKTKITILILVIVAIVGGLAYRFLAGSSAKPASAPPPVPVVLAPAITQDMPLLLELTGRGEPAETVTLRARVDGQVQAVPMVEGSHVKRGDLVVQLDPADFAAKLRQAEANLARDQAQAAQAKAQVERYQGLKQKGFVSDEKVGDVRAAAGVQESAVKASQAALELARLQLSYAAVRAPIDGVVGAKQVYPGAAVKVNDTILGVVNKLSPLMVSFSVPEKYLPRIQSAMKGGVMKVKVAVPGSDAQAVEGDARFLDNTVDTTTGTIRMKATVANKDERLAAGQFLNVSLVLDVQKDAVTVPAEAVQQGPEGQFVYVAKADETVEMRKVQVGAMQKGVALIAKGVEKGEIVVIDGQLRLSPNAKIRRLEPKAKSEDRSGGKADAKPAPAPAATTTAAPSAAAINVTAR
ncbi:MAG TPA: efflux RND transporter periplasmic adaptor subunit [Rhodocyclaceae bacterium]|nr:efflux RND transporter periplasmic adaptor subunit [Rhodocyclaceae bacterium]